MTEQVSKYPAWVSGVLVAACIVAIPAIFPVGMFFYKEYTMDIRYQTMFMEIDKSDWASLNRLCESFSKIAIEQKWDDVAKKWSDLCLNNNKDFLDKYAGK